MMRSALSRCNSREVVCRSRKAFFSTSSHTDEFANIDDIERIVADNKYDDDDALHFSLSGTGPAFFSWMVGFSHGLRESGLLSSSTSKSTNHLIGISGGSMCATLLAADFDLSSTSDVMVCGQEQSDRCRDGKQKLGMLVNNMMDDLIDDAAAQKIINNKQRKVHIAMVDTPGGSLMKAYNQNIKLCSNFTDKEDIRNAVLASTHLPYLSNGNATTIYRGKEVVDAGITGQMYVPTKGKNFVNINIFPPLDYPLSNENALGQYVVQMYSKLNNKANGTIHAHPYLADDFGLHIFGLDDMLVRPLKKDEALRRHHLGYQSFLSWFELQKASQSQKL